jgi:hypothetical protein
VCAAKYAQIRKYTLLIYSNGSWFVLYSIGEPAYTFSVFARGPSTCDASKECRKRGKILRWSRGLFQVAGADFTSI